MSYPSLQTPRLTLRKFQPEDGPMVEHLAGDPDVARMTLNIPHPYETGMAQGWIRTHQDDFEAGRAVVFAIEQRSDNSLLGAVGLIINQRFHRAELGYWIGKPFWSQGIATEASRALLDYGFQELGLHRIHATHLERNPASGRVMQKLGMQQEGVLREHVIKWDEWLNLVSYGILASEWKSSTS